MTDEEHIFLKQQLESKFKWFNKGSMFWSTIHHWGLAISAIISASAAIILKITWIKDNWCNTNIEREDVAALLAGVATIISSISAVGGFGRKWQTNRISRGRIERLQIALSDPAADASAIREELQDIIKKHDEGIVGGQFK